MKKFLIIQLRPEDETSDSEYQCITRFGGLAPAETERLRIEKTGLPSLNLENYAAIIVGGSPFDISTPAAEKSDAQKRIESDFNNLFADIIARDFPFLGACSGNGLLGNYLGATISKTYGEAVGGVDINLTEAGRADPLLTELPPTFRALVGHKEACDATPAGATLLASSDTCPVQMFRVKENIYATQFHPEANGEEIAFRINVYKHHGYCKPEEVQGIIDAVLPEATPHAQAILRRFVERYR